MTYSIRIETSAGKHTVTVHGDVPDGTHVIRSGADPRSSLLSVERLSAAGLHLASVASSNVKEQ